MTDHDDKLSRRYRKLGREEPPSSIDAAILSAARRAVQPRALDRWAVPVSIAALLVLGVGVSLHMQMEQPGIETSEPTSSTASEYPMAPSVETPPPAVTPPAAPAKRAEQPAPETAQRTRPKPLPDAPAQAGVAEAPAAAAQALAPQAAPRVEPPREEVQARSRSDSALAEPRLAPLRSKREATTADSMEARDTIKAPRDEREVELERIARLRNEGKHLEADRAIEEFRRKHPDYRIPEAMWERVKPR